MVTTSCVHQELFEKFFLCMYYSHFSCGGNGGNASEMKRICHPNRSISQDTDIRKHCLCPSKVIIQAGFASPGHLLQLCACI